MKKHNDNLHTLHQNYLIMIAWKLRVIEVTDYMRDYVITDKEYKQHITS